MNNRHTFLHLFQSDIRYGLSSVIGRLVIVLVISSLVMFISVARIYAYLPLFTEGLTFGETILCTWQGMYPYTADIEFDIPTAWLGLLAAILYVSLEYPLRNLGGAGSHMIIASHSRWTWWMSKCTWVIVCTLVCFLITFIPCIIAVLVTGGTWDLSVRPGIACVLGAGDIDSIMDALANQMGGANIATEIASINIVPALLVILLALIAFLLIQLVVSLLVHPAVGFFATIAIMFLSAYYAEWWMPGNYLMLSRSDALINAGFPPGIGAAVSIFLSIFFIVLGGIIFNHKDIVVREADAS